MKRLTTMLVALFAAFVVVPAVGEESFISEFVAKSWRAADGLPGNTTTEIIQDSTGYLYIGTYEGLVRFDGVRFQTLNRAYSSAYPFSSARSLLQDSRGALWVGANDEGLFCLHGDGSVRSFTVADGLPNNSIRALVEDKSGNVWVGTASGVAYITPDWSLVHPDGLEDYGEQNILVLKLSCDADGCVWCTTSKEGGVYCYKDGRFTRWRGLETFPNAVITCVKQDTDGDYWFGVEPHYAVRLRNNAETVYQLGEDNEGTTVNKIYQDSSGTLWFGCDSGVTILHGGELYYYNERFGLSEDRVVSILEDREGCIWLGLDRGGIQRLKPSRFKTVALSTSINAIAEDRVRDVVWLCGNNGLYCYDSNNGVFIENDFTRLFDGVRLRHVTTTPEGDLLISAYAKYGISRLYRDGHIKSWLPEDGLVGGKVRASLQAANGDLYVATTTGLSIIDYATGDMQSFVRATGLPHEFIMCLYEAQNGDIWCGTDGGGVFVMRDRQIAERYTTDEGLIGNVIFTITQLADNDDVWICTGTGISRLHNGEFASFPSSMMGGLGSVFQMLPDEGNTLWLTCNGGIASVKRKQLEDALENVENAVAITSYGASEGVTSGGVTSTSFSVVDSDGRIWFTLIDGFSVYDPTRIKIKTVPVVDVQSVTVDGTVIPYRGQEIMVKPESKRLIIRYTALGSLSPELMEFRYRLNGFEDDYSPWSQERQVSFTSLKPGRYTFNVQALSSDDMHSAVSEPIVIIKGSYVWQQLWFWVLIVLGISAVSTLTVNLRFRAMTRYQQALQQEVARQTVELREAAEASKAASKAKSDFLANMSHEIRTPINAVLGMDEMILREAADETIRGYAANIKNASNTLLALINDILDFSKIEAGKMEIINDNYDLSAVLVDLVNMIADRAEKKGLSFTLDADPTMPKLLFGDSMRLKQCILNILTNAVKYTESGSVTFTVCADYDANDKSTVLLHVSVSDTGIGIKAEDMEKLFSPFDRIDEGRNRTIEGTGLGMSIVQKTLAMLGSKLEVQSEYGRGSTFSFTVKQAVTSREPIGDVMQAYRESLAAITYSASALYAPHARLLVVDDTEMNLAVVKGLLKRTGVQLDTALSGYEALEKVCQNAYDILFIDHRMPGMDGIQTLEAMQTQQGNKCLGKPCIALTANAISGAKEMYLQAGFTDYLSKPVKPEALESIICKYLPQELLEVPPEPTAPAGAMPAASSAAALSADIAALDGTCISVSEALSNCGNEALLREMLSQYHDSIAQKSAELQALLDVDDIAGYRVKIHALKSTSRLIGAATVSEQAAALEAFADKEDKESVLLHHGAFMELYKSYGEKLRAFAATGAAFSAADADAATSAPVALSGAALTERLKALYACAEDFDIDGADAIIAELSRDTLPQDFAATFEAIRICVRNVDFDGLTAVLSELELGA